MTYANPEQRLELIAGLRALCTFLDCNPEVPAPLYANLLVFPPGTRDSEKRHEIQAIASRIGAEPETSPTSRHYSASRKFGPVEYRAVAIPSDKAREQ